MAKIIMLPEVRCAFLTLGEPEDYNGNGRFRWSSTGLVPYGTELKAKVDATIKEVAFEKWGKKADAYLENILVDPKGCCWQDGKKKPDYDGFAGHFAMSAHRGTDKSRPLVYTKDKVKIYKDDNSLYDGMGGKMYAGMFVNLQVEIWAQDNKEGGKAIRATLLGIQAFRDGDAFGGGAAPNPDAFAEISDGADADDLG